MAKIEAKMSKRIKEETGLKFSKWEIQKNKKK